MRKIIVALFAVLMNGSVWAASSTPVTSTVNVAPATSAITLSPSSVSALANHRTGAITLSAPGTLSSSLTVTLSDGGIGGRFYNGAQSFATITSVTLPAGTGSSATLYYCPPYNRTSTVTITASSGAGSATTSATITAYTVLSSSTINLGSLSWDTVAEYQGPSDAINPYDGLFQPELGFTASGPMNSLTTPSGGQVGSYTQLVNNSSGNAPVLTGGNFTVNGGKQWYRLNTAMPHNAYQANITINAWGGGTTDVLDVGMCNDHGGTGSVDYIVQEIDNKNQTVKNFQNISGTLTQIGSTVSGVTYPAGTQFSSKVFGNLSVGGTTQVASINAVAKKPTDANFTDTVGFIRTSGGPAMAQISVFQTWFPCFGVNESSGSTISVTAFTAGYERWQLQENIGYIMDVSQGGGAPLMSADATSIYLNSGTDGATAIFKVNMQTWTVTFQSVVFINDGTFEGCTTGVTMYIPTSVAGSGITGNQFLLDCENYNIVNFPTATPLIDQVIITSTDLTAINTVSSVGPVVAVPFAGTVAAGGGITNATAHATQTPIFTYNGSTWAATMNYCTNTGNCSTNGYVKQTSSGSSITSSTWTNSYTPVTCYNGSVCDGVQIAQIGSNAYGGAGYQFAGMAYWKLSDGTALAALGNNVTVSNRGGSSTTFTYGSPGQAPWANLVAIPGDGCTANPCSTTRYVLPVWQNQGTGPGQPGASTIMYEAQQRSNAAQYTWTFKD